MRAPDERNMAAITRFAGGALEREIPPQVLAQGVACFIDWFAVALGAHGEPAAKAVRLTARRLWPGAGDAIVLLDEPAAPGASALVNGTLSHCLDFDDLHVASVAHLSGATLAAALAVGSASRSGEEAILRAFICGFEVGARLGAGSFGSALNHRGVHATGVIACLSATVAAGVLMRLDEGQMAQALGVAATQCGGLTASFGTMAKPFHAGRAALGAVMAVELAKAGFEAAADVLEPGGGLASALVQDGLTRIPALSFGGAWEILNNTFKPYASCLMTHAPIDAARSLAPACRDRSLAAVTVYVNPLLPKVAGIAAPRTALEGKFSTAFCVALGLSGYRATDRDFSAATVESRPLGDIARKVRLEVDPAMPKTAARMRVEFSDGGHVDESVPLALGNPENPMSEDDLKRKFLALVEPVLGSGADELFACLKGCRTPGSLRAIARLTSKQVKQ